MYSISQETIYAGGIFVLIILVLLLLEQIFPLRIKKYSLLRRLIINLFLSLISFIIVLFFIYPAQEKALTFTINQNFGLLKLFELPFLMENIIGFLLMDLLFYYWHLLNHKISFLWRFHNVHHLDPDLDVSTAFRFHFGEIGFSTMFRIIQISVIGINPITFLIYEACFTANTIFQHSNIKLPIKVERIINRIIVTPRMHGIHHSQYQTETNSNYSTVFSWWDVIHNTIRLNIPQNKITIGIPAYSNYFDNNFINVLLSPFKRQKYFWQTSNAEFINRGLNGSLSERLKLEE